MTTLIYDGSWTGILCCVFEIYNRRLKAVNIITKDRFQHDAFGSHIIIQSAEPDAKRVWNGLEKRISKKAMRQLYCCYLSGITGIENSMCEYIRLSFDMHESPENAFGLLPVLRVSQVDKMVHREKHRMEAFIRFKLTKDELYYASIEPDFNVLPLIAKHFKARYADQRWLIFDLKRDYGIYYDLSTVAEVAIAKDDLTNQSQDLFANEEVLFQKLWTEYFTHVNITERKNLKLHVRHVPKRYWKYLTEKII